MRFEHIQPRCSLQVVNDNGSLMRSDCKTLTFAMKRNRWVRLDELAQNKGSRLLQNASQIATRIQGAHRHLCEARQTREQYDGFLQANSVSSGTFYTAEASRTFRTMKATSFIVLARSSVSASL